MNLFEPIPASTFKAAQLWSTLNPQVGQDYVVATAPAPYEVMVDFEYLQPGDLVEITAEVEIYGPEEARVRWAGIERWTVGVDSSKPGKRPLIINEESLSEFRLVSFPIPEGPWAGRLSYKQVLGMNRLVRLMRVS